MNVEISILIATSIAIIALIGWIVTWFVMGRRVRDALLRATAAEAALQAERDSVPMRIEAAVSVERERTIRAEAALEAERASHAARVEALQSAEQQLRESFAQLSNEALKASSEQFLTLAQERLERQQQAARSDLNALFEPLRQTLDLQRDQVASLERQREQAYGSLNAVITELKEGQRLLNQETSNLVKALSKPQVRGRWGEMQLRRVIEMAGMLEHCDFATQVTVASDDATYRPDVIIRLPNERQIVVDSKVPLEGFLNALNAEENQRAELFRQHARQLRNHIDAMSKRNYPAKVDGAHEFTVIFVPGETFYQTALEYDAELLDYAFGKSVILASPNTLIAILKAAALGWRETRLAAEAQRIRDEGEKIFKALRTLAEHMSKLGTALDRATDAYNEAIGNLEQRLLPPARKMNDLGIQDSKDMPTVKLVDKRTRSFTRAELMPASGEVSA
jgi:DNA recombination protein RmuC